ncbi:hypothetical protein [Litoribacillus peritrichatus]|uniref:Uncharacterized protein n=1 Tax=Litoribacillus peritrichatus TaxID=718191 RepID=A0ABP7MJK7_9GAMM
MKKELLEKSLENIDSQDSEFIFDESTITWQVSYVWLICGTISEFSSIEEFFLYSVVTNSPFGQGKLGEPVWKERVDFQAWINGLELKEVDSSEVCLEIESAKNEALDNKMEWEEDFDLSRFDDLGEIEQAWRIEEKAEPRFSIGLHWGYIWKSENCFYYLERHWES